MKNIDISLDLISDRIKSNQLVAEYQWLDCDNNNTELVGEVNQYYFPNDDGNYAVEIQVLGGCIDTSECMSMTSIGILEIDNSNRELLKIIDLMGRETQFKPNTPLIFIYNDGTRERVIRFEK